MANIPEDDIQSFKEAVRQYVKYDEDVRKMQIAIRERKRMMEVIGPGITEFMRRHNVEDVNLSGAGVVGKLRFQEKKVTRKPRHSVTKAIKECGDDVLPPELKRKLLGADLPRETTTVSGVRRVIPRQGPNSLSI